ncbi:MAG: hypothetical protein K0U74_04245 [Alphaproteobacteria bacterium]|nr:hypothetical protein [Alphaproteobacteria bacterium]
MKATEGPVAASGKTWVNYSSQWLRIVGRLVAVAAIIFFGAHIYDQWEEIPLAEQGGLALALIATFSLIYGALTIVWGANWSAMLFAFAPGIVSVKTAIGLALATQLAKYLPGNVFHFASRHAVLRERGVAHGALFQALAWENLFLVAGSMIVASVAFSVFPTALALDVLSQINVGQGLALFGVVVIIASGFSALWGLQGRKLVVLRVPGFRNSVMALAATTVFFLGQAVLFIAIYWLLGGTLELRFIGPIALSWLVGFIVPGAPAGLGVREVTFLSLVDGIGAEPLVLLSVTIFRFVTTFGDLVAFAIGMHLVPRRDSGS